MDSCCTLIHAWTPISVSTTAMPGLTEPCSQEQEQERCADTPSLPAPTHSLTSNRAGREGSAPFPREQHCLQWCAVVPQTDSILCLCWLLSPETKRLLNAILYPPTSLPQKKKKILEDFPKKEILKFWPDNNPSPTSISYVNRSIYIFLAKWFQATLWKRKKSCLSSETAFWERIKEEGRIWLFPGLCSVFASHSKLIFSILTQEYILN